GQVDDHIALVHELVEDQLVEHRALHEPEAVVATEPVDVLEPPSRQVVECDDAVAPRQNRLREMRADETGAASYEVRVGHRWAAPSISRRRDACGYRGRTARRCRSVPAPPGSSAGRWRR